MATTEFAVPLPDETEIHRGLANFPEDIWGDRFEIFPNDNQENHDMYTKEIELLKEEVRIWLITPDTMDEKLKLIDTLERLGISYHFEQEIEEQLEKIFNLQPTNNNIEEDINSNLFIAGLQFRLLRQHGFNISSGIFHNFLDADGKFKEVLSSDIKGLLSLYEAAQVRTHEDNILEEALAFSIVNLKHGMLHTSPNLAKQVNYALKQAVHKCIPRIAARHYISVYEENESKNQSLLRLAKLDFNSLQLLYKQELSEIIRWVNDSEIISKLPYSRARIPESYLFGIGMFYEPQHSFGRIISAKTTLLITAIDDTYDSYGTLDELDTFTDAIERWDAKEIYRLPSFMRTSYMALLTVSDEIDKDLTRQGRLYAADKYKEEWKQYARSSYTEAQWFIRRELPTFPEYLRNGLNTSLCYLLIPTALLAMENATKDVYDWLSNYPEILVSLSKICRLTNDIGSHEREKQIGGTGIECYMKQYNVLEQEAMKKFEEIVEDAWKDMNKECFKLTAMSREVLMRFFNLGRIVNVFYKHGEDGFTNSHKVLQPHIRALLVDPIVL